MSRNVKIAIASGLILVLAAAGATVGYFQYEAYKLRKVRADAERYYVAGEWRRARQNFRRYLAIERTDIDALTKYADASNQVLNNRPVVLQDIARAYMQLYDLDRTNHEALEKCIDAYVRSRDWNNLEYNMAQLMGERPDDLELLYYRALSLDRLGRWDEAKVHYEKLVETGSVDHPDAYRNLAALYQERGDAAGALALFDAVMEKHPGNASLWAEAGLFFIDLKDQDKARDYLANAEKIDQNAPDVIYLAARYALARLDYEDGLDQLTLLLAVEPDRPRGYVATLIGLQESGQIDKAIEFLNSMDPYVLADQPELCMARVELCVASDRLDDAKTHLDVYKAWYPEHTVPQEYLDARIMLAEGNASGAVTKLTTINQNTPDFRQARFYLAVAQLRAGNRSTARDTLDAYIHRFPDDDRAKKLFQSEFTASDQVTVDTAVQLLSDDSVSAQSLALTARSLFNSSTAGADRVEITAKAVSLAEKAIEKQPDYVSAYAILSEIYLVSGDPAKAEQTLDQGISRGIAPDQFLMARAGIALAKGDITAAFALYDQQLALGETTFDGAIAWADMFRRRASLDAALDALSRAADRWTGNDVFTLENARIASCLAAGDVDRAFNEYTALDGREDLKLDARKALALQLETIVGEYVKRDKPGDIEHAEELAQRYLDLSPSNAGAALLLARVKISKTPPDIDGAEQLLRPILLSELATEEALITAAEIERKRKDLPTAIQLAQRAVAVSGRGARSLLYLARLQVESDLYPRAVESLEAALQIDPTSVEAMTLLVEAYRATNNLNQARDMLRKLQAATAGNPDAARQIALMGGRLDLQEGQNLPEIEQRLREHLAAEPEDARAVADLAKALAAQGKVEDGVAVVRAYIKDQNGSAESWMVLAGFFMLRGPTQDYTQASTALTSALLADRNNPEALRRHIELQLVQNRSREALGFCDRYLALFPNDPWILYQRSALALKLGEPPEEVRKAIDQAISYEQRPEYLYVRALAAIELGEYGLALQDLNVIISSSGAGTAAADLALAQAYAGLNDMDRARSFRDSALRKSERGERLDPVRLEKLNALLPGLPKDSQ